MKLLTVWLDERTGTYTVAVDAIITHECLASDEVAEIVKEIMEEGEQK